MTIKSKFYEGIENVGNVLPTIGKVIGATLVLKSVKYLKKPTKKLMKGGSKL